MVLGNLGEVGCSFDGTVAAQQMPIGSCNNPPTLAGGHYCCTHFKEEAGRHGKVKEFPHESRAGKWQS